MVSPYSFHYREFGVGYQILLVSIITGDTKIGGTGFTVTPAIWYIEFL